MPDFPVEGLFVFLLVLIRVLVLFSFLPIFSDPFTPLNVRLLIGLVVAMALTPSAALTAGDVPTRLWEFASLMLGEAMLGAAMGLTGRFVFAAVQVAGNLIGDQIGFQFANVVDPNTQGQVPVVSNLMFVFSVMLFFTVNGHHYFLAALGRSFETAPPGFLALSRDLHIFFIERMARCFYLAVQISLPSIAVGLAVMMGMGMLVKGVPQVNVFLESFPTRIIAGLLLMAAISESLVRIMLRTIEYLREDMELLLRLFGG